MSLLDRILHARTAAMIASFRAPNDDAFDKAFDEFSDPGRSVLSKLTDDELATMISAEPTSKQGLLAASIFRERESWRTPARWALIVSGLSFALAFGAFCRTL